MYDYLWIQNLMDLALLLPLCNCPYRRASQSDVASPSLPWVMLNVSFLRHCSVTAQPYSSSNCWWTAVNSSLSSVFISPSARDKHTHTHCCLSLDGRVLSVGISWITTYISHSAKWPSICTARFLLQNLWSVAPRPPYRCRKWATVNFQG